MMSKLSYEDIRRLARSWFAEAREKSAQHETKIAGWKAADGRWNSRSGASRPPFGNDSDSDRGSAGDRGGD
jgi:hypothetical protein